jgi:exosome complex RNA-binding protein Rrp4
MVTSSVRRLLRPDCAMLASLGEVVAFELVIGMNGRVWVKAGSVAGGRIIWHSFVFMCLPVVSHDAATDTLLAVRALEVAEFMSPELAKQTVRELARARASSSN